MAFVKYPKGTPLSIGGVADGVTEYNDQIVKPASSPTQQSYAPASSGQTVTSPGVEIYSPQSGEVRKNWTGEVPFGWHSRPMEVPKPPVQQALYYIDPSSGVFYTKSGSSDSIISDPSTLSQLKSGSLKAVPLKIFSGAISSSAPVQQQSGGYSTIPGPYDPKTGQLIDNYIDDILGAVVASNKTINSQITSQDLTELDIESFLKQAEASLDPEYKEKFITVKDNLTRELTNIGYDLNKKVEENARVTRENLETGTEDLAGRGLAFSGQRTKFEEDTEAKKQRADESARELSFRSGQELLSDAEQKIGTQGFGGYNIPQIGGRSLAFSTTPLTGSLVSEKSYLKESMAKELERQERERRAYSTRQLSFA